VRSSGYILKVFFTITLLLFFHSLSPAEMAGQTTGTVIIINETPHPVEISVGQYDFFGKRSWRPLVRTSPGSYIDLPDVRIGTFFKALYSDRSSGSKFQRTIEISNFTQGIFKVTLTGP